MIPHGAALFLLPLAMQYDITIPMGPLGTRIINLVSLIIAMEDMRVTKGAGNEGFSKSVQI